MCFCTGNGKQVALDVLILFIIFFFFFFSCSSLVWEFLNSAGNFGSAATALKSTDMTVVRAVHLLPTILLPGTSQKVALKLYYTESFSK